jgi:hypothetical protein
MSESYTLHPATAHALGCGMNNGRPVIACICGLPNKGLEQDPDHIGTVGRALCEATRKKAKP